MKKNNKRKNEFAKISKNNYVDRNHDLYTLSDSILFYTGYNVWIYEPKKLKFKLFLAKNINRSRLKSLKQHEKKE